MNKEHLIGKEVYFVRFTPTGSLQVGYKILDSIIMKKDKTEYKVNTHDVPSSTSKIVVQHIFENKKELFKHLDAYFPGN